MVYEGRERDRVTDWAPAQGQQAARRVQCRQLTFYSVPFVLSTASQIPIGSPLAPRVGLYQTREPGTA